MVEFYTDSYVVEGLAEGNTEIRLEIYPQGNISVSITVEENSVRAHKLDPIVATLRLSLDSAPESRLEQGSVTLEVLHGVQFSREEAVVTASVVFADGHRSLVTNPAELVVNSSNSSIVSVSGNTITGESEGEAVVMVTWINPACGDEVLSTEVVVTVLVDDSRPTFAPDSASTRVCEDSPIGYNITVVTATVDNGLGDRGSTDVQYQFQNGMNFNGLFSLDQTSGELVLNGQLDRETTPTYTLFIEATNSAQRRAEGGDTEGPDDMVSGSGSGGGGILTPNPMLGENVNVSLDIAVLTVRFSYNIMSLSLSLSLSLSVSQLVRVSKLRFLSLALPPSLCSQHPTHDGDGWAALPPCQLG